jgi:hypothetical protein
VSVTGTPLAVSPPRNCSFVKVSDGTSILSSGGTFGFASSASTAEANSIMTKRLMAAVRKRPMIGHLLDKSKGEAQHF